MVLSKLIDMHEQRVVRKAGVTAGRAWQDQDLASKLPAVRSGDTDTAVMLLKTLDPNLRALRVDVLATECVPFLDKLEDGLKENDDPDLALLAGAARIIAAWEVRTGAWAKDVGRERFEKFQSMLPAAYEHLVHATNAAPDRPDALNHLQWFGMGAGMPRKDLDFLWERIIERDPWHYVSHHSRLQVLCRKWKGSHEEMFAFAREVAAYAHRGDPLLDLVPRAHVERFIMLQREREDDVVTVGDFKSLRREYLTDPGVRAEITDAADLWLSGDDDHPGRQETAHEFGAALYFAGETELATRVLRLTGTIIPRFSAWIHWESSAEYGYVRARDKLGIPLSDQVASLPA
ncbi:MULTISPECIES: hypothetical protein [Nocardiopsis]|uniref:DUF4034 domain-containing protein n=1 Tax=Nocardiopsis sinuspersici TaxID=501010 RepID=A0A1V3BYI6_9ACTN|nr:MULTISPECIES: hypothetical protein [Nocardiopsis]OOC53611.1 hypothetical protein NOSIN_07195 [Nocardiopsis sinuspersici]